VTIGCDNISALDTAFNLEQDIHISMSDYGILRAIRVLRGNNTIRWTTEHV
jgi:hypothetical protein